MRPAHHATIIVCLALAVVSSSCVKHASSSSNDTDPSGPPGGIEFTVSPSSVAWNPLEPPGFSTYCNSPAQTTFGPFVWRLRETRGGTVTVNTFTARTTASNGQVINDFPQAINTLAIELIGVNTTAIKIEPNQTLTSRDRYTCQNSQPGSGFPIFFNGSTLAYTVSGIDSNGTAVTSSASLNIRPVF